MPAINYCTFDENKSVVNHIGKGFSSTKLYYTKLYIPGFGEFRLLANSHFIEP